MFQAMSEHICSYMIKKQVIDSAYIEVYRYGFECLVASLVQSLILFTFCYCWGLLPQGILFVLCFGSLKRWAGGYHAPNHAACFILFSVMAAGSCLAAVRLAGLYPERTQVAAMAVFLLFLTCTAVFRKAPVPHPNNPKTDSQLMKCRRASRKTAVVQTVLFVTALPAVFVLAVNWISCLYAGILGSFFAAVTLYIPNQERR